MKPTDDELRMLRDTYQHCRRWAHAGQVGTNAVTLLAALDELLARRQADQVFSREVRAFFGDVEGQSILERRAAERAAAATPTDIP